MLRLAPPLSYFRRRLRYGVFSQPTFGPPEREGDEGERRWQAAVAGAVGSLGLLWEPKSRRVGVAQQYVIQSLTHTSSSCGAECLFEDCKDRIICTPRDWVYISRMALFCFSAHAAGKSCLLSCSARRLYQRSTSIGTPSQHENQTVLMVVEGYNKRRECPNTVSRQIEQ